jgi:imidazolonepropionase-like amidohydrolase
MHADCRKEIEVPLEKVYHLLMPLWNRELVDVHVHLTGPDSVRELLAAGIAAVRNAGTRQEQVGAERESCGHPEKPVVISSCWALFKRGCYGSRFGVPVETKREIQTEIARLKHAGADIIKIMASGIVSLRNSGSLTSGGFDRDELRYIVDEARTCGLDVMAHANGEPAITAATEAGVRSIEHGFFMTERALQAMARNRVFWTPTIGALQRASNAAAGREQRAFVQSLINSHLRMVKQAHEMGVPLGIGTDCVLPDSGYKTAYDAELSFFEQAGLSRETVMRIASENGAQLLGITA